MFSKNVVYVNFRAARYARAANTMSWKERVEQRSRELSAPRTSDDVVTPWRRPLVDKAERSCS
jgi:hypothetical protein